jgi:iron(III) transport system ATP-binding protein
VSAAGVELRDVVVRAGGRATLDRAALSVPAGATLALVGPSGAGKSTLLRAVAGLVDVAAGEIRIGDDVVAGPGRAVDPARRGVGLQFQGFALWPHLTAAEHLAFVLKAAGVPADERAARTRETLERLGLGALAGRKPDTLSGGERQRLALARAVVARPRVVLLDEPTASLDPATARDARALVSELGATFGATAIVVTHDREEACELGATVAVLRAGRVLQCGPARDLYEAPSDAFVATFFGDGALLSAVAAADGRTAATAFGAVELRAAVRPGARGRALVRPEQVAVVAGGVAATVRAATFVAGRTRVRLRVGDVEAVGFADGPLAPGSTAPVVLRGPCPFFAEEP